MNDEAVRKMLVSALAHEPFCELRMSRDKRCQCQRRDTSLDNLLPVVREIAAEELREAAQDFGRSDNGPGGALVALSLAARADALTKPPDGPVR